MGKGKEGGADPKIERIPLRDLKKDPGNARKHGERNRKAINSSLKRFGPGRSLVIDKDGIVRAGNGTLEEASDLGMKEVLVVEPGPNQLVAVRRSDWSEEEAQGYAVADNRSQDLSEFDDAILGDQLQRLGDSGISLEDMGFSPAEVEAELEPPATEMEEDLSAIKKVHILISMTVDQAADLLPQIEAMSEAAGARVLHAGN